MENSPKKPEQFSEQASEITPQMVTVEIEGKPFQVPAGVTLMKAMWYAGKDVLREQDVWVDFVGLAQLITERKMTLKLKPV